ncbi:MAG TPA: hypothetical protein DCX54_07990 [Flavobacteriales bacterium]|nr:hypothetical protein [Flavobacteriales bacterium]
MTSTPSGSSENTKSILTLAKGASISLVGRSASRLLMLLGQAILARTLGPQHYGLFSLGWSMLQISGDTGQVGLPQGIIHLGAKYWKNQESRFQSVLQQAFSVAIIISLVASTLVFMFSADIASFFGKPDLKLVVQGISIALAFFILLKVFAAATRISQRVQFSIFVEDMIPALILALGALIFVYYLRWNLVGGMLSVCLAYGTGTVLALIFVAKLYPGIFKLVRGESFLREILKFSLPATLAGIFGTLIRWITRLFLGYLRPEADVGLFQAASQLAALSAIILAATNTIFTPMISRLFSRGETEKLNELYKISTKWAVYLSLPLVAVLFIFSQDAMILFGGPAYQQGSWILAILIIGQLVNTASGAVAPLHLMLGYQSRWMWTNGVALFISFFMNWGFITLWGLPGAALASACSIAIINLAGLIQIKNLTGLWPYDRRYWKGALALVIAIGVTSQLLFWRIEIVWIKLAVAVLVSVIVFSVSIFAFGLDQEDQDFLNALRSRLLRSGGRG